MPIAQSMTTYQSWFRLKNVPGLGNILFKRLMEKFGSPDDVFSAPVYDLKQIRGMGKRVISGIHNSRITSEIEDQIRLIRNKGFRIAVLTDSTYPSLLKRIPDPPPYLTYIGTLENPSPAIAIVGSRQATSYGLNTAEKLGYDLGASGFQIISGMALGIDTAAHEGALRANGKTLAILGSGLGKIYPRENRNLFHKIADNGAVISEFNVFAAPDARHFPMRNRIICGISTGTIVVEAAARSGSLITARLAAEYGREVFAVPGNIHSANTTGTHALLKQGATLVENHRDVMEELHHMIHGLMPAPSESTGNELLSNQRVDPQPKTAPPPCNIGNSSGQMPPDTMPSGSESLHPDVNFKPDTYQNEIITILGKSSPLHIDTIIEQSTFHAGAVTGALLDLELSGMIEQRPGKMFYLSHAIPPK